MQVKQVKQGAGSREWEAGSRFWERYPLVRTWFYMEDRRPMPWRDSHTILSMRQANRDYRPFTWEPIDDEILEDVKEVERQSRWGRDGDWIETYDNEVYEAPGYKQMVERYVRLYSWYKGLYGHTIPTSWDDIDARIIDEFKAVEKIHGNCRMHIAEDLARNKRGIRTSQLRDWINGVEGHVPPTTWDEDDDEIIEEIEKQRLYQINEQIRRDQKAYREARYDQLSKWYWQQEGHVPPTTWDSVDDEIFEELEEVARRRARYQQLRDWYHQKEGHTAPITWDSEDKEIMEEIKWSDLTHKHFQMARDRMNRSGGDACLA